MKGATLSIEDRARAIEAAGQAALGHLVALRAGGQEVTGDRRDELLARCAAGMHVELEADVLAYEQETGAQNRKFVRVRDGAMMAFGKSGAGRPVLRDHRQSDSMMRAGTIVASRTEKLADGKYAVHQKWQLTAPWACEMALRGLLGSVSVGMYPTGPVTCSACGAEVLTECWHFPGDRMDAADGDGEEPGVVEWIFDGAEIVETSIVNVPAVPGAAIEGIRAAMSAALSGAKPQENGKMKNFAVLITMLGLAATAGEDEVLSAVGALKKEAAADKTELGIVKAELKVAHADLEAFRAEKRKGDEDKFITDALASGRIAKGDEPQWRDLYQVAPDRAAARMSERLTGSATPVSAPRQSGSEPKGDDQPMVQAAVRVGQLGGNIAAVRANLIAAGKTPAQADKLLADHVGGKAA